MKNAPKRSSKYLKDRICKIKQYLNYLLMIVNKKYSSNPIQDLFKSSKKIMKNATPSRPSTAVATEFLRKIPKRKKISNEHFFEHGNIFR